MKGINTSGQELNSGGVASFSAPRDGVSHLAFPALAPERKGDRKRGREKVVFHLSGH